MKCAPDAAAWSNPVWQAIEFSVDEPHLYRYSYESDGKTFTAKAMGDLDCDGTEAVWVMKGTADNGNPTITIEEPAPEPLPSARTCSRVFKRNTRCPTRLR